MVVETHQAEKIWTYDRTTVRPTVQGATFNMRGQTVTIVQETV